MDLFQGKILNNTLLQWSFALGLAALIFFGLVVLRHILRKEVIWKRLWHGDHIRLIMVPLMKKTFSFLLFLLALYFGSLVLDLSPKTEKVLAALVIISFLIQMIVWANYLIDYYATDYASKKGAEDPTSVTAINVIGIIGKIVVVVIFVLVALDRLGINITALVAGLGVGGIAVALAVQNILGDLLASLSIILDKPFMVGDALAVGEFNGTVEKVGLKTTRLRSLSGEQLVFPNSDLLQSRIKNFKRMVERRVELRFGIIYETPLEKIKRVPDLVKEIIQNQEKVRLDRVHLKNLGESSLNFEYVYFVLDSDYGLYMDIQQKINLELLEKFAHEKISFAYPTRTLFVQKLPGDGEAGETEDEDKREEKKMKG